LHSTKQWSQHLVVAIVLAAAFFAGANLRTGNNAHADSRRRSIPAVAPPHLKSGAARSETILLEIASTLKRIEAHLERLEQTARRTTVGAQPHKTRTAEPLR